MLFTGDLSCCLASCLRQILTLPQLDTYFWHEVCLFSFSSSFFGDGINKQLKCFKRKLKCITLWLHNAWVLGFIPTFNPQFHVFSIKQYPLVQRQTVSLSFPMDLSPTFQTDQEYMQLLFLKYYGFLLFSSLFTVYRSLFILALKLKNKNYYITIVNYHICYFCNCKNDLILSRFQNRFMYLCGCQNKII